MWIQRTLSLYLTCTLWHLWPPFFATNYDLPLSWIHWIRSFGFNCQFSFFMSFCVKQSKTPTHTHTPFNQYSVCWIQAATICGPQHSLLTNLNAFAFCIWLERIVIIHNRIYVPVHFRSKTPKKNPCILCMFVHLMFRTFDQSVFILLFCCKFATIFSYHYCFCLYLSFFGVHLFTYFVYFLFFSILFCHFLFVISFSCNILD